LKKQIAAAKVNLDDPATTIALLKLNAVVGVTAFANPDGSVRSMVHPVRDLSLDSRQLVRWLAQPRPQCRCDRFAGAEPEAVH
jgi:hypothetical protein